MQGPVKMVGVLGSNIKRWGPILIKHKDDITQNMGFARQAYGDFARNQRPSTRSFPPEPPFHHPKRYICLTRIQNLFNHSLHIGLIYRIYNEWRIFIYYQTHSGIRYHGLPSVTVSIIFVLFFRLRSQTLKKRGKKKKKRKEKKHCSFMPHGEGLYYYAGLR